MLEGFDNANNVLISSYLKAVFIFAANNSGANWGVQGSPDDTSIAVPILAEVVSGH
jgi:hypothetical protein